MGQAPHTVSVLTVQAACWVRCAGQVLQGTQWPLGVSHWPSGQLVHWVGRPLQVAQAGSQGAQVRSAAAWQPTFWYWPAGHMAEQGVQVPPLRKELGSHTEHCWSLAVVQTTVPAQPGRALQVGQVSAVSFWG